MATASDHPSVFQLRQLLKSLPIAPSTLFRYGSHFVIYPLNYTWTRLGGQNPHFYRDFHSIPMHVRSTIRSVRRTDGIRGLYRGFGISVISMFIYRATLFKTYDYLSPKLFPQNKKTNFLLKLLFIQGSTSMAALIAYPYEAVRRAMIHDLENHGMARGISQTFLSIVREQGFRGLFTGSLSNCLKGTAGAVGLVLADELIKSYTSY